MKINEKLTYISLGVLYLLIIALKIALLVWLYKIGYLLHYFIVAIVFAIIYYTLLYFYQDKKLIVNSDNKVNIDDDDENKEAPLTENDIEKLSANETNEVLNVLKNVTSEDNTEDNHEDIPE